METNEKILKKIYLFSRFDDKEISKIAQLAKTLSKPFFLPRVPTFILKIAFGEMANVLLEGSRVSNKKLTNTGFEFKYPSLSEALREIVSK